MIKATATIKICGSLKTFLTLFEAPVIRLLFFDAMNLFYANG